LHISETGWSSGAPYGTVATIEGNNVNDNNWGHLVVTDTTTTSGNGGSIRFATGDTSALNPFSGIQGVSEGTSHGGLGFFTRPSGGTATERIRVLSSGEVGIGTTSPDGKTDIAQAQNTTSATFTTPHLALTATGTTNTTGFTGISYASSTLTNYGWTVGAQRTSTTGGVIVTGKPVVFVVPVAVKAR